MEGCRIMTICDAQISEVFQWYTEKRLLVNRVYQRKLVWTLAEKQSLISTILQDYPLPLFIMVGDTQRVIGAPGKPYEIIDGLQRIEAIISFICNKFPVRYNGGWKYFNIDSIPGSKFWVDQGILRQKEPSLSMEESFAILKYRVGISFIQADTAVVEDVFKRINATGRKLSKQCLRHAGVTSNFSRLVQDIASTIRGDYTADNIIELSDMTKYSINNKGLDYGLTVESLFWTKHDITPEARLRQSKDEEIIANICNCLINGNTARIAEHTLDSLYNEHSKLYEITEKKLTPEAINFYKDLVCDTIGDLEQIFLARNSTFSSWCFSALKTHNKDNVFIILVLAIAGLKQQSFVFTDYAKAAEYFYLIADKDLAELNVRDFSWKSVSRVRLVERIAQQIKKGMSIRTVSTSSNAEVAAYIENAVCEEQMYDFKIGLSDFGASSINSGTLFKCLKTLTAMANTKLGSPGYILVGIADNEESCSDYCTAYSTDFILVNDHQVPGINAQALAGFKSIDRYMQAVRKVIKSCSDLPTDAMAYILQNMHISQYDDRCILVMSLLSDTPVFFGEDLFIREYSSTVRLKPGSPEYISLIRGD